MFIFTVNVNFMTITGAVVLLSFRLLKSFKQSNNVDLIYNLIQKIFGKVKTLSDIG